VIKRVAELEGAELDYWVAVAEGKDPDHSYQRRLPDGGVLILDRLSREEAEAWAEQQEGRSIYRYIAPYSTLWNSGGPIIEREAIGLELTEYGACWGAWYPVCAQDGDEPDATGPTPLVAAMRAFVASKLGDTVKETD